MKVVNRLAPSCTPLVVLKPNMAPKPYTKSIVLEFS
jgi:hypothetical protein